MSAKSFTIETLTYFVTKIKTWANNTFLKSADTTTVSALSIDSTPTTSSSNLVTSGGVKTAIDGKESTTNKVTSLSSSSTDTQYPSAKAVYDELETKVDKVEGKGLSTNDYDDTEKANVAANTSARHTHSNKALLDTYSQTEANLADAVSKKHSHENKDLLDTYEQTEANLSDAVTKKHSHNNKALLDEVEVATKCVEFSYNSATGVYSCDTTIAEIIEMLSDGNQVIGKNDGKIYYAIAYTTDEVHFGRQEQEDHGKNCVLRGVKYSTVDSWYYYNYAISLETGSENGTLKLKIGTSYTDGIKVRGLESAAYNKKGEAGGVASLDSNGKVPNSEIAKETEISASSTDDQLVSAKCVYDSLSNVVMVTEQSFTAGQQKQAQENLGITVDDEDEDELFTYDFTVEDGHLCLTFTTT